MSVDVVDSFAMRRCTLTPGPLACRQVGEGEPLGCGKGDVVPQRMLRMRRGEIATKTRNGRKRDSVHFCVFCVFLWLFQNPLRGA